MPARFIAARHGTEPPHYPHPDLEPILDDTYGVVIWHEQIIAIFTRMTGCDRAAGDVARRALADADRLPEVEDWFRCAAAARGVTCTVRYADLSATRRSRSLPEASQHTVLLARAAYAVYDSLGLQRARVRSIALRADSLRPADRATRQLTLDARDDKPLAIEAVADRARARYGHQADRSAQ
jgi:hypothetical protein